MKRSPSAEIVFYGLLVMAGWLASGLCRAELRAFITPPTVDSTTGSTINHLDLVGGTVSTRGAWILSSPALDTRLTHAYDFTGANSRMRTPVRTSDVNGSRTIIAVVTLAGTLTTNDSVANRIMSANSGSTSYWAFGNNNSHPSIRLRVGATGTNYEGATTWTAGTTYHVTFVVNESAQTVRLILNGNTGSPEISRTSTVIDDISTNAQPLWCGCNCVSASADPDFSSNANFNSRHANWTFHVVKIFDHALTDAEIQADYNTSIAYGIATKAGFPAIGWKGDRNEDDQSFDVTVTVGSDTMLDNAAFPAEEWYYNTAASTVGFGEEFEVEDDQVGDTIVATVVPNGTQAATAAKIIQPTKENGHVYQYGVNQHTEPSHIMFDGKLLSSVITFNGHLYVEYDGEPVDGELFTTIPELERERQDMYHTSMAFANVQGGILAIAQYHNEPSYACWASTPAGLPAATAFRISPNTAQNSYQKPARGHAANQVVTLTRDVFDARFITITDPAGTPSYTTDFLQASDDHRPYPRANTALEVGDGSCVHAIVIQDRIESNWLGLTAIFRDATGQCYNIMGHAIGGTALGTGVSPKLTDAQLYENALGATGFKLLDAYNGGSGQRYSIQWALTRLTSWTPGTKHGDVFTVFTDNTAENDSEANGLECRLMFADGSAGTVYESPEDSNPLGMDGRPGYRIAGAGWWKNGSSRSGVAQFVVGLPEVDATWPADDYHGFGPGSNDPDAARAAKFVLYEIDLNGVDSDADLADPTRLRRLWAVTPETNGWAGVERVGGNNSRLLFHSGDEAIDTTLWSGKYYDVDLTPNLLPIYGRQFSAN